MPRTYHPTPNDHLSEAFSDLVPDKYKGTDSFLDIVTWNIRYFHDRDRGRVQRVLEILNALNADIIVLQEILEGSLEVIAQGLEKRAAGYYRIAYGTTGGDQRIAMMYDLDWVRAKETSSELFGEEQVLTPDGKNAFPRLPLLGVFTCLPSRESTSLEPFDFQLVGLHLKSQRGGGEKQRARAAERLRLWLIKEASRVDADVILVGDWNEAPDAATWRPFHELEQEGKALFSRINDRDEISHLMYRNKKEIGSRLDLGVVSLASAKELKNPPEAVRWKSLDKLLASNPNVKKIRRYISEISAGVSDHMPVVMRLYLEEQS